MSLAPTVPNTSIRDNYPATGCEDDGTEADFVSGASEGLGENDVATS